MGTNAKIATPKFSLPVSWSHTVTSVLGDPRPYGSHEGVDLAPTEKLDTYPVYATAGGRVLDAGFQEGGYGYFVKLDHGGGFQSIYGHFEGPPAVAKGDTVSQGQIIGNAGSSGYSTGRHLHFSLLRDGEYLNPLDWVGDAIESAQTFLSEAASRVLQTDPCAARADVFVSWQACRREHGLDDSEDAWNELFKDIPEDVYNEIVGVTPRNLDLSAGIPSAKAIVAQINTTIIEPLKNAALNTITWPFRSMINTMQLSETPLTTGADTVAWLQQPDNQRLYIASQAALVIAIVLIVVVFAQFVKEPAQQIVQFGAETAAKAAIK